MKGIQEREFIMLEEALGQVVSLIEMALGMENPVGAYEVLRLASTKLDTAAAAIFFIVPHLLSIGEMTEEEVQEEAERVKELVKQFVSMRVNFYEEDQGEI